MTGAPEHWDVLRLKACLSDVVEQVPASENGHRALALESVESWTGRIHDAVPIDGIVKRFRHRDVLFGKLRPYLAKVARPEVDGACVGEFLVLRPRESRLDSAFAAYLLRSRPVIDAVNALVVGARMPRAEWDAIGSIHVPVPPSDEQAAIIRFLDHVDRRIQRAIRAKQKLIALLNEQKQAVIHRAVTRGLDPNVELKPSRVDGLGSVPAHWQVLRLRRVLRERVRNGLYKSREHYASEGTPMIQMGEAFASPVITVTARDRVVVTPEERERWLLLRGDLLFARRSIVFEGSGKCSLVGDLSEPHVFESSLIRVRPDHATVRSDFLWLFLGSHFSRSQLLAVTKQVTISGIDGQQLKDMVVLIPPADEQAGILADVERLCCPIGEAILAAEKGALHLREYRTRLIADVVTGKLDVREAAARLPDEAYEPQALDEIDVEASDELELDELETVEP